MINVKTIAPVLLFAFSVFAQTQTTGRIAGTVKDERGALIVGAGIVVINQATGEERTAATDASGNFAVAFLSPGLYRVRIEADGFNAFKTENAAVSVTETTFLNAVLTVAGITTNPVIVNNNAPLIKTDNPTLGLIFDGQTAANLPLATRNFTQLFGLAAGATAFLTDNSLVGRNTQNVSVNGARLGQNNFQINGIDANFGVSNSRQIAAPAPESVAEFKIQTSVYDASFGRAGGGNIQIVTRSGTNKLSGVIYDYFTDTALNANNPFLKAARQPRPVLERNIFGFTLGGVLRKDRAFFFVSYQTTRERNGASRLNSISSKILIGQGSQALTDDRSQATLLQIFMPRLPNNQPATTINPVALRLLNARLPNGQFLIPTPQTGARYSGSAVSTFREEQFNTNFDYRLTPRNLLSAKIFFARAPQIAALTGNTNVPGFPTQQKTDSLLVSIQDVQSFGSAVTNEARLGFNLSASNDASQPPFQTSDFDINRPTAAAYPGFPIISIAIPAGGIRFGTGAFNYQKSTIVTPTFADTLSLTRRTHTIRAGLEFRYYLFNINVPVLTRGNIVFQNFNDFLVGVTQSATLANGIPDRALRTADYNFFVQDDWKFSPRLTLNLGVRYELDLPPYDTRGRISTFDPTFYCSPTASDCLPGSGLVQAGNPAAGYDLSSIPNVGKRVLKSLDANNFAPRVGLAYAPFTQKSFVLRAGYGIYYSRSAFAYLISSIFQPPFYFSTVASNLTPPRAINFSAPFPANVPAQSQFPLPPAAPLFGNSFDRNIRTPYIQQFNAAAQFGFFGNTTLEIAYVGSRGLNLFRQVAINQARLDATGNAPANAQIRAPFQSVMVGSNFLQDQSTAQSTYHSMQLNLVRRLSRGLQFQASYTFSKSLDNASGAGGAGTNGLLDTSTNLETSVITGNQLDNRANRGLSNFDRKHRFVSSFIWQLPRPPFTKRSKIGRVLFSGWQLAGIVTAMSGLPIDVVDSGAATFYLGVNGGARPNFVPGESPTANVPYGYYFNPFAFMRPVVPGGQSIPSSNGTALAGATGTDFGNVGRNSLRGPNQFNTDFSIGKRFRLTDAKNVEFRADFFNLFNNVNFANPISNLAAVPAPLINANTGRISRDSVVELGFGQIISTGNNPRIIQLALKFNF
jgi:hypothetical protein